MSPPAPAEKPYLEVLSDDVVVMNTMVGSEDLSVTAELLKA